MFDNITKNWDKASRDGLELWRVKCSNDCIETIEAETITLGEFVQYIEEQGWDVHVDLKTKLGVHTCPKCSKKKGLKHYLRKIKKILFL